MTAPGQAAMRPCRLHFAVLTYNGLADTRRCLQSIAATTPGPFTVHVLDNGSDDGTREWLAGRGEPWLRWRGNATNRGVPGGRNDLLTWLLPELGDHDWLVFCDNDLEFQPGWLEPFLRAMAAWPEARVLGKVGHFLQVLADRRILSPAPIATSPVDVVSGGFACFVRADAARMIGAFDERLGLFWHEDDDWCVRALQLGHDVVAVPEAAILHHEHGSGAANPGLAQGGSLDNQRYLAEKWRAAGWLDRDGWVRRERGPYLPPEVRDALQRRAGRTTPIGRAELAAAWLLLDRTAGQPDPVAWFREHREPVSACTATLVASYREHADPALARHLDAIAVVLQTENFATRLHPLLRLPPSTRPNRRLHGLCSDGDFDDPAWLAVADQLDPGHPGRDPHGRARAFWEAVTLLRGLEQQHGGLGPACRVRVVGDLDPRAVAWLRPRVAELLVDDGQLPAAATGHDVVILVRTVDPDQVAAAIAAAAPAALFAFVGDVVLNGAPQVTMPAALQLEHDLLARAGLRPVAPLDLTVDDATLEACCDRPSAALRYPQLVTVVDDRLLTSFVAFGRRAPVAASRTKVLAPALPRETHRATVGVDLRTLSLADSSARGIGHYATHHLAALARRAPALRLVGYLADGAQLPDSLADRIEPHTVDAFRPGHVDLVHLPDPMNLCIGFDSPLRVFRHQRTTLTWHDLTPLRHYLPEWPRRNREAYLDRLRQIQGSDACLLTNSRFTADDVVATLGIAPERVIPVLAGLNASAAAAPAEAEVADTLARLGVRRPFVLHVGAHDPHKNFAACLNAFLHARAARPLQLVVVGAVDHGIEGAALFCARRGVPDVLFTGYLPRPMLGALYAAATAVVSLSRAEGFGFPLLEAMAAGCPVVASDATSHPEVLGDAGLLVDPDDAAAAGAQLLRLLEEPALAAELRARGRARARQFTWDDVADRTLAVWRQMLGQTPVPATAQTGRETARR